MKSARSPFSQFCRSVAFVIAFGFSGAAVAQSLPDGENGRYTFSPVPDGVLRLDTRTGAVTTCADKGQGWACYAIPDERAALDAEIGRLQIDNDRLKAELAQREPAASGKIEGSLPKSDSLRPPEITSKDGERKLEIPLPSDRDVDRAMTFLERVWRRLIEIAGRVQKDAEGKI
jgi:hypothetical protein